MPRTPGRYHWTRTTFPQQGCIRQTFARKDVVKNVIRVVVQCIASLCCAHVSLLPQQKKLIRLHRVYLNLTNAQTNMVDLYPDVCTLAGNYYDAVMRMVEEMNIVEDHEFDKEEVGESVLNESVARCEEAKTVAHGIFLLLLNHLERFNACSPQEDARFSRDLGIVVHGEASGRCMDFLCYATTTTL